MDLFECSTRKKDRFNSPIGLATIEDLWDIDMEVIDAIAQGLYKQTKDGEIVSFINAPETSKVSLDNKRKFEVVKRVIEVRLADRDKAEKAAATRGKKQRILEMLEEKKDEDLKGQSVEELERLLDGM